MKKETKLQELERRIAALETRPIIYQPYSPPPPSPQNWNPNLHYHGAMPCYQNPCYWCGTV